MSITTDELTPGFFCDDCQKWSPYQEHECLAYLRKPRLAAIAHEICRWCKRPSKEGHPAGVLPGRWRCTVCRGWQDDEYAPDQLHIAEED